VEFASFIIVNLSFSKFAFIDRFRPTKAMNGSLSEMLLTNLLTILECGLDATNPLRVKTL
jgi:hypothetical protein